MGTRMGCQVRASWLRVDALTYIIFMPSPGTGGVQPVEGHNVRGWTTDLSVDLPRYLAMGVFWGPAGSPDKRTSHGCTRAPFLAFPVLFAFQE